jgi:hypothetical protein
VLIYDVITLKGNSTDCRIIVNLFHGRDVEFAGKKGPRKIAVMEPIRRESNPDYSTIAHGILYG